MRIRRNFKRIISKTRLQALSQQSLPNAVQSDHKEKRMNTIKRNIEIANVCLFFNIACYYEMRTNFDNLVKNIGNLSFETKRYFDNKDDYKEKLIKAFSELVYSKTIEIIRNNTGVENVHNWIRAEKGQSIFLLTLTELLTNEGFTISEKYVEFVKLYKV